MPVTQVQTPDGKLIDIQHPDGAAEQDILSYASQQYALDPSSAYSQETSLFDDVVEFGQRALGSAGIQFAQAPSGLQERFFGEEGFGEDDQALVERNRRAAQSISESFGYDEGYEGGAVEFLSGAIGGSLPSYGPALVGAGTGSLIGGPVGALIGGGIGILGASAIGAGANVSAGMEETARAVEMGRSVSDEDYETAMGYQALIGASEGLPVGREIVRAFRFLSKTVAKDPKAVRTITDYVASALKQGTLEAAQEATAGLASNANLKEYINPDIDITDSLASDLGAGGVAGAFFDVAFNLATRKSRLSGLDSPDEVKPLREELVAAEQELRDGIDNNETARRERLSERLAVPVEVEPETIGDSLNTLLDQEKPSAGEYQAFGQSVVAQLGDSFPTEPVFEIVENDNSTFQIQDPSGQKYGREVTPQEKIKLQPALVALNAQTVEESIFQNNRMVINESSEDYSPSQVRTLHRLGRIALGPESLSYSTEAANYAGGTVPEKGFLPALSPQEIIKNNIPRKQQTIAQRINVRRLKNNQPTTNRFALSEIRREIGSDVGRLADYESGTFRVNTFRALPFQVEGKFAVVPEVMNSDGQMESAGDYIFDRPATAVERQAAKDQGKKRPRRVKFTSVADASNYAAESNRAKDSAGIPIKEIMGDPEFSVEAVRRILDQKNISSDINSPEIKQLAARFTGNKLRKDQAINDLTPAEGQLFYLKLSQLPRFDQPTKIPSFKLRPYTASQVATATDYYQANGKDINRAELEYSSGRPLTDAAYKEVTGRARRTSPEGQVEQGPVAALPPPSVAPDIKKMLSDAINRRLKALGLSDISGVVTDLVRNVERDADGNVYLNNVAEGANESVEGGYQRSGAKTIQVALDAIMSRVKKPEDIESAVIDVLNHEIVHALRELDVITQQELQLLERLATKYRKPDTNQTYMEWATETYAGDTAVNISEEAVAEMIRDGISGRIIIDSKPAKLTGKPRSIFNRIVKFFKGLFNTAKEADSDYESFTQFITDLESGAIGERQRGRVRTLYRLEQISGQFIDRRAPVATTDPDSTPENTRVPEGKAPDPDSIMGEAGIDDMMFSRRSAVDMFEPSAFDYPGATGREAVDPKQINPANKARHTVVDMPIDMFLGLAQVGEGASKTKGVQKLIEEGVRFKDLPMLTTKPVGHTERYRQLGFTEASLVVTGHEGRHRARGLKAAGYKTMPVRIWDDSIRWGEQDSPKSGDAIAYWPEKIVAQEDLNRKTDRSRAGYEPRGLYVYPMFISRDGSVNFQPAIERPSVSFEVAPDPRNTPLLEAWNSLPESDKLQISEEVARAVAPKVLAEVSASGEVLSQIGSYGSETNPSFAIKLSSGDPTDAASALGFVLQQESMMIVSPRPYEGAASKVDPDLGTETRSIPAIFINVGDKSQSEIAEIYNTLRVADGAPDFSGQSTIDGNMMILLDGSPDVDAAVEAFDKALDGQYDIDDTVVFSSFPQAEDYNYETEVLNTRVSPEGARRRLNNTRAEVQAEIKRRVQESRNSRDGRSNRGDILERLSGAVRPNGQLSLTHYSNKAIQSTDPSKAGTGADRTRRFNRVSSGTYLGITEADTNPYVRETMLGSVASRFEVDPFSLYDLDRNAEGLAKKNPNDSWDLDGTLKAVSEAGYIGLWTDSPTLGKVALVTEPLDAVTDAPDSNNQIQFSRRSADRNVERSSQDAVDRVISYAESVKLDPAGAATVQQGPLAFSVNAGFSDQNGYAPSFTTPSRSWFDRVVFQVQDKLTDLKAIEEAINEARKARGEPPLAIQESAYTGEETIPGKLGEFDRRFQRNELQPLVDDMSESGVSLEQMDEFLVLRHAIERNERVRNINPSIPDAGSGEWNGQKLTDDYVKKQMLTKYGMRWNDKKGEWEGGNDAGRLMSRLASKVDKINSTTLSISEQGGLLTKQDREFLDGFFKYYTPLRGIAQDEDIAAETNRGTAGSGGSLSIVGKEVKRLMGRQTEAVSPLSTIISDRGRQTARAVKNVSFGKRLVELIKNNPNDEVWQLISPDDPKYRRAFDTSYTYLGPDKSRYGERKSDISKEGDKKNWVKRVRVIQDPVLNPSGQELLGVKVDGEQYYVHFVNPSLRKAAINLDAESTNVVVQALSSFTRVMSYVNTSLNPEFVMGNFARDVQTAIYNIIGEQTMEGGKARNAKKIVRQVLKRTFPHSIKVFYKGYRDPSNLTGQDAIDFREFMQTGAKTDWFHSKPPEQQKKNIELMIAMANGTFKGNATQGMLAVKDFIDDGNAAVENGVRLATFVAARDAMLAKGIDRDTAIQQAATLAKNLTVNFNRRGNSGQLLNALYLFFNASVQGTVNTVRGLNVFDPNSSRTKQAVVGSIVGFGALMAALAESLMDEEEFDDIPEYIRDRNMIIPDALWGGDPKKYSTIPLPYGYNVFYNLGENAYLVSSGALSKEKAAVRGANVFLGSFNPLGTSSSETYIGSLLKTAMPQAGKWVLELAMNENYFGAPIYPPDNPFGGFSEPLSRRSFKNTAPLWKNISEVVSTFFGGNESEAGALEFPPDAIGYLIGFFGGGAGTFAERTFLKVPSALLDETAELEVRDIPFVRRIRGEINAQPDTEQYYERREALTAKLNQANKVLRGAGRAAYIKENRAFFNMMPHSKTTEKALKNLRQSLRAIQKLKSISPDRAVELAQQEKHLQDRIDTVINRFNSRYDEVVGENK